MAGKRFASPATLDRMQNWKRTLFPFQYGLGLMRTKSPRILSPFSAIPELIGHSGAASAFLFYSPRDHLYIADALNQLESQGRPCRLMMRGLPVLGKNLP